MIVYSCCSWVFTISLIAHQWNWHKITLFSSNYLCETQKCLKIKLFTLICFSVYTLETETETEPQYGNASWEYLWQEASEDWAGQWMPEIERGGGCLEMEGNRMAETDTSWVKSDMWKEASKKSSGGRGWLWSYSRTWGGVCDCKPSV